MERSVDRFPFIALCGYAYSGKDTAALALIEKGWKRVAFADALKEVARGIGWDGEKDDHGRWLLQQLGQQVREHIAEDAWVQAVAKSIQEMRSLSGFRPTCVVLTDCRYQNEAQWVRSVGGKVVRVSRPNTGPVNNHISESDLDDFDFDAVITNDGTVEELGEKLTTYATSLLTDVMDYVGASELPPLQMTTRRGH